MENFNTNKEVCMREHCFEIYTLNPVTRETGWDIEHVVVVADNKKEAVKKIKKYPLFDCIISYGDWWGNNAEWPIWDGEKL